MKLSQIKMHVENELYEYWKSLPEPKPLYVVWYYGWRKDCIDKIFTSREKENATL